MADNPGRTAIIVAVIATLGVLAAKYMDVFGHKPAATLAPASPISGQWRDQFGSNFTFAENAGKLVLTGNNVLKIMHGAGSVSGKTFSVTITNSVNSLTTHCTGERANPGEITADCRDSDGSGYEWNLRRGGQ